MTEERFRIGLGECIGRGGFGTVYRGTLHGRRGFAKQVAVKVVAREAGTAVAERLRDEARMLALIRHRAIVHVDDLLQIGDDWALVMEWIDGVDLGALVRLGPVPVGPAVEIVAELAGALHVAFTTAGPDGRMLRLEHRDVKLANVLLTADGATKLLDFGIARANFGEREALTLDSSWGSVAYMSPQRLDGDEDPGGDVYALGVVAYEMLTGRSFGKTSSRRDRHEKRRTDAVMWVEGAGVPSGVRDLLSRMLAYTPDERPDLKEVELTCIGFRGLAGPSAREWAEQAVPLARSRRAPVIDELGLARQDVVGRSTPEAAGRRLTGPDPDAITADRLPRFGSGPAPSLPHGRRWALGALGLGLIAVTVLGATSWATVGRLDGATNVSSAPHGAPPRTAPVTEPDTAPPSDEVEQPKATLGQPEPPPVLVPEVAGAPEQGGAPRRRRIEANGTKLAPSTQPGPAAPPALPPIAQVVMVPATRSTPPRVQADFAPEQRGMVLVDGAPSARLVSSSAQWPIPGPVPPGDYIIVVVEGGAERRAGEVTVGPGEIVRLSCDAGGCLR